MPESNDIDELLCEYLTLLTSYGQIEARRDKLGLSGVIKAPLLHFN